MVFDIIKVSLKLLLSKEELALLYVTEKGKPMGEASRKLWSVSRASHFLGERTEEVRFLTDDWGMDRICNYLSIPVLYNYWAIDCQYRSILASVGDQILAVDVTDQTCIFYTVTKEPVFRAGPPVKLIPDTPPAPTRVWTWRLGRLIIRVTWSVV